MRVGNNYRRGADFEREIAKVFRDNGFDVVRAAASKGLFAGFPVDVIVSKATRDGAIGVALMQMKRSRSDKNRQPWAKFTEQKWAAKRRCIPWEITFEEWWHVWEESGKWEQRGRGTGKYVMCRRNDSGAYAPDNVYIGLYETNAREAWTGRTHKQGTRELIRAAHLGKKKSAEHVANLSGTNRPLAKLTWDAVSEIRASSATERELAAKFGVTRVIINRVRRNLSWKESARPVVAR